MPEVESIIEGLLNGKDLFVVLESDYDRPYKESYNLDTVMIQGSRFWGKFASVHAPIGHDRIKVKTPFSYAYNNFCGVVCTMDYAQGMQRFTSTKMYSRMQFKTKGNYILAVDNDNTKNHINYDALNHAVENSLKIKLVICDLNEVVHCVPVHTIELYGDKLSVGIDTNFECIPKILYDSIFFYDLEERFLEYLSLNSKSITASTEYEFKRDFSFLYFNIDRNLISTCSLNDNGGLGKIKYSHKWFKVFCEE